MNRRAVLFNDLLSDILTVLEKSLKGTTFILCDLYKLFEDVHALPEIYGFRNVVDSCCIDVAGNQTRECAPGRAPCADRTTHAYFDPFHPSESMHKLWFQLCFKDII
ncbi:GDSL esterase/lipase At3g50400-like [Hibiscus syriacus]|nr:GDSL esterase/lipase At3g50400-like [Hibiscus syriacus]